MNSYDTLLVNGLENKKIANEIVFLNKELTNIANKYEIPLKNKENLIYRLHNSVHLQDFDPRISFILYDSNGFFAQTVQGKFPLFFQDIKQFILDYFDLIELDWNNNRLNYLIYILFTYWDQIYLYLEDQFNKINLLLLSNQDAAHAALIHDVLKSSLNYQLSINYFSEDVLTYDSIKSFQNYDLIISNFPVPSFDSNRLIQIETIPTDEDIEKIKNKVAKVLSESN